MNDLVMRYLFYAIFLIVSTILSDDHQHAMVICTHIMVLFMFVFPEDFKGGS